MLDDDLALESGDDEDVPVTVTLDTEDDSIVSDFDSLDDSGEITDDSIVSDFDTPDVSDELTDDSVVSYFDEPDISNVLTDDSVVSYFDMTDVEDDVDVSNEPVIIEDKPKVLVDDSVVELF